MTLPEQYALSVLFCGSYDDIDEAWLQLGREARKRGLKPAGMPRAGTCHALHGPRGRAAALLLAAGPAGGEVKG